MQSKVRYAAGFGSAQPASVIFRALRILAEKGKNSPFEVIYAVGCGFDGVVGDRIGGRGRMEAIQDH
jgi:hypothetical protein